MELIVAGDLSPSAARVAEEAGIGLRTVFRHFDDMDALYSEITATVTDRVMHEMRVLCDACLFQAI